MFFVFSFFSFFRFLVGSFSIVYFVVYCYYYLWRIKLIKVKQQQAYVRTNVSFIGMRYGAHSYLFQRCFSVCNRTAVELQFQ